MKQRVAVVSSSFPPSVVGGVAAAHWGLLATLRRHGVSVRGFSFRDGNGRSDRNDEFVRSRTPAWANTVIRIGCNLLFRNMDRAETAYETSDILQTALGMRLVNSRLRSYQPRLVILPDHGCPALYLAAIPGAINVQICHHNPMRFSNEPLIGNRSLRDARTATALERRALKRIRKVVCPSNYMRLEFFKTYGDILPTAVIPNIADTELIRLVPAEDPRPELGLPPGAPLIYIPSAGSILKGSRYVFEIIRRITAEVEGRAGFYLSGPLGGPLERELSLVWPTPKVFAPGALSHDRNLGIVKACSFAVSPTLVESYGMALLEALLCGVPVLAFDVGGVAELVRDGLNGYVVRLLDLDALIQKAVDYCEKGQLAGQRRQTLQHMSEAYDADAAALSLLDFALF